VIPTLLVIGQAFISSGKEGCLYLLQPAVLILSYIDTRVATGRMERKVDQRSEDMPTGLSMTTTQFSKRESTHCWI
jgi:hypothetical protein